MSATIVHGYCDEFDLQSFLSISPGASTGLETLTIDAINAASREIDAYCGQAFWADPAVTSRVYYADGWNGALFTDPYVRRSSLDQWAQRTVGIDACYSVTSVATDDNDDGIFETTWLASNYQLEPLNGIVDGVTGWPATRLRAVGGSVFRVIGFHPSVQITGNFGWAAIPDPVRLACIRIAAFLMKGKDAPQGVMGSIDFGGIRLPRDEFSMVVSALAPYRTGDSLVAIA